MEPLSGTCGAVRLSLGAHALGALPPGDEAMVRGHLSGCAACRAELAGIAGIPALLGRLDEAEVAAIDGVAAAEAAGSGIAERVRVELARRRRRARLRLRVAAGLGGLAVAASAAAIATVVATRVPPSVSVVAADHMAGSDPATGVAATADVYAEDWGSSIHLVLSGVPTGDRCVLMAVAQDGSRQVAGTWEVGYTGKVDVDGAAGMHPGQLTSLEVVTSTGTVLVTLT
jgi:anti-sigma factor RsiW